MSKPNRQTNRSRDKHTDGDKQKSVKFKNANPRTQTSFFRFSPSSSNHPRTHCAIRLVIRFCCLNLLDRIISQSFIFWTLLSKCNAFITMHCTACMLMCASPRVCMLACVCVCVYVRIGVYVRPHFVWDDPSFLLANMSMVLLLQMYHTSINDVFNVLLCPLFSHYGCFSDWPNIVRAEIVVT